MNKINQFKKLKEVWIHVLLVAIAFYILPLLAFLTNGNTGILMLLMLFAMPIACFVISLFVGKKIGINLAYVGLVALLFVPTVFIFYNSTAWVYIAIYAVVALIGNAVGRLLFEKK
ncbi:MAG: hypothetical protein R3Y32_08450 [Bacillota bacterium]